MPKKYHIRPKPTPNRFVPPGKYVIVEQDQYCLHCPTNACIKKDCPYDVYTERRFDSAQLRDIIDNLCKGCFRCIQGCKNNAISRTINPEYLVLGDEYWTPEIVISTYNQAETGKIPVSGAGYGGPFTGPGFDSMWTDMSEIVRPTRDGIHGREYIATNIDLGKKLPYLEFNEEGGLISEPSTILELPIPIIFNPIPFGVLSKEVILAQAKAAKILGIFMIIKENDLSPEILQYKDNLIPLIDEVVEDKIKDFVMVEFVDHDGVLALLEKAKAINPKVVTLIRLEFNQETVHRVLELTKGGAEVIHLCADEQGKELTASNPRFIKEMIREVHLSLVEQSLRDRVTLIVSGGIAEASHLAKAIICGVDGVAIDLPLLVALECRLCRNCEQGLPCPVKIETIDAEWATKRMVNLMNAWHSQLIEVMGAMGIREARRLRGEVGRAMNFTDLEEESFRCVKKEM
ncbi:MAG: glutamate synthase-related protein [bacterium]